MTFKIEAAYRQGYEYGARAEREEIIHNLIIMCDAQEILLKSEMESNECSFINGKIMAYTSVVNLLVKRAAR